MQTVTILSGNFTTNGNLSGYNASGQRIHIPARQLEALGISPDSKIDWPIYSLVVEREFSAVDANGQPTGEKFKRLQAGSTFLTEEAMIEAANADKLLAIKTQQALRTQANSAGLSEQAVDALVNAAF